jgi:tRNA nucleotidyltransferase/poly(A) polymerase
MNKNLLKEIEESALLVGGAVRDKLLNLETKDRDFLVYNHSEKELIRAGFRKVEAVTINIYLHPETNEEYTLPRGETLDSVIEDLGSRDFTINSMAMDTNGEILDPFGGQDDIKNKVLRHTSDAFSDDPGRIIRLARFQAKLPGFTIAPETKELVQKMIETDTLNELSKDRVYQEIKKGLAENNSAAFLSSLRDLAALPGLNPIFQELYNLFDDSNNTHFEKTLDALSKLDLTEASLDIKLVAILLFLDYSPNSDQALDQFLNTNLLPSQYQRLAKIYYKYHQFLGPIQDLSPQEIYSFFKECRFKTHSKLINDFCKLHELRYGPSTSLEIFRILSLLKEVKVSDEISGQFTEKIVDDLYIRKIKAFL